MAARNGIVEQWRLSACIHSPGSVIARRGKSSNVKWNIWFGPMWMNNPLGLMQMKWQISKEEWHGLVCQIQMSPHFQLLSILSASWITEVQELLAFGYFGVLIDAGMAERTHPKVGNLSLESHFWSCQIYLAVFHHREDLTTSVFHID